ncbi:DUF5107 domain-containing protein [Pleomorphovibrio marinus]|uniref:DUF5107 domain-containing protein n=1 Tax=Pleomorphovibrio marinus TaxID=2164132 RepID=UPI000E09EFD0|nr:DUF5107 domain-containing protein [Pleomorphovibrio marinus]
MHTTFRTSGLFLLSLAFFFFPLSVKAQKAKVSVSNQSFLTYPFSDPSPIAAFAFKPDIYPYHKFEGFATEGVERDWKVITLENEFLKVTITPEIGGRVWGAIEKSSGEDFIYQNEVVKFRNIAMRGPWTSGGIEFNFGIIGHAPSTATPVDYHIEEHEDGSVSCVVGAIDLPNRSQWRVKIILEKDKAYFTTDGLWYNPSPYRQPYYNWMTAAAHVDDDLEFFYPGHLALQHSGDMMDWPVQDGRKVSMFANNRFGSSKSHHMAGSYQNHFGGYFHDKGVGFGHFSNFDDMPGKKLWLWALSRSGGIWEDLLTDKSGQYMEFQAGRMLNQFQPSSRQKTPLTKASFSAYGVDQWTDYWFPVKGIGGISAAMEQGAFFIQQEQGKLSINFNPFQPIEGDFQVYLDDQLMETLPVSLSPMDQYTHELEMDKAPNKLRIHLNGEKLFEWAEEDPYKLSRSYDTTHAEEPSDAQALYYEARQAYYSRDHESAAQKYQDLLAKSPAHQQALIDYAELLTRQAQLKEAFTYIQKALANDFYDPQANFVAGTLYSAKSQHLDALEAYGWAARSMEFRSSAYTRMAEIHLQQNNHKKALEFAKKAMEFNIHNLMALQVEAAAWRLMEDHEKAMETLEKILSIDPLHFWARFEQVLLGQRDLASFSEAITNEFPFQTYLEIASTYQLYGMKEAGKSILKEAPDHPLVHLWLANSDEAQKDDHLNNFLAAPLEGVFPFRIETLDLLEKYALDHPHWKMDYYLALNLLAMGQKDRAISLLHQINEETGDYVFYLNRSLLIKDIPAYDPQKDLENARSLAPEQWRTWYYLAKHYEEKEAFEKHYALLKEAKEKFAGNYMIEMDWVKSLAIQEHFEEAMEVLDRIQVLPYEGAGEGRMLYESLLLKATLQDISSKRWNPAMRKIAKSREWPENLGVGKPFDPDERMQDFMEALVFRARGNQKASRKALEKLLQPVPNQINRPQTVLNIIALRYLDMKPEAEKLKQNVESSRLIEHLEYLAEGEGIDNLPSYHPYPLLKTIIEEWKKLD